jgi:hypothetical protein
MARLTIYRVARRNCTVCEFGFLGFNISEIIQVYGRRLSGLVHISTVRGYKKSNWFSNFNALVHSYSAKFNFDDAAWVLVCTSLESQLSKPVYVIQQHRLGKYRQYNKAKKNCNPDLQYEAGTPRGMG